MPDSVEMPAPVRKTTERARASSAPALATLVGAPSLSPAPRAVAITGSLPSLKRRCSPSRRHATPRVQVPGAFAKGPVGRRGGRRNPRVFRVLKWLVALAFTVAVAVGAVVAITAYDELTATLPPIDRLLEYDPPVATRVYAADGSLIEEFYRERRYRVPIAEIPPLVRNAFLAAEDSDFFAHRGIDFVGIARAVLANLQAGDVVQGASTITQQVVKALLLTPERSYERKLKEILLSLRLEQHLTKERDPRALPEPDLPRRRQPRRRRRRAQLLRQVGRELTPAEAAMLAGLPAAPSRYSPMRDPDAARKRQHYVLRRMLEEHFLSAGEYQAAVREELHLLTRRQQDRAVRNYYTEAVRLQLEDMFGAEAPYNQGYASTRRCSRACRRSPKWRCATASSASTARSATAGPSATSTGGEGAAAHRRAGRHRRGPLDPERIYEAVVTGVAPGRLDVTVGPWSATVTRRRCAGSTPSRRGASAPATSSRYAPANAAKRRAPPTPTADAETDAARTPQFYIAQTPQIEAALVAIDMERGGSPRMVGGYDFLCSQFNRALQAQRQPG